MISYNSKLKEVNAMSTYPIEKILLDYANGRMDVEMATGHSLQHVSQLYTAQTSAATERQALRQKVSALEELIKTLQTRNEHLQPLPASLAALQRAVSQVQHKVDNLITQTSLPSQHS